VEGVDGLARVGPQCQMVKPRRGAVVLAARAGGLQGNLAPAPVQIGVPLALVLRRNPVSGRTRS
jgi:hypothetical protein